MTFWSLLQALKLTLKILFLWFFNLCLVMLNLNFFILLAQHSICKHMLSILQQSICKHMLSIRVENSVDLDQMALSEASWSGATVF